MSGGSAVLAGAGARTPSVAILARRWLRLLASELRIVFLRPRNLAMLAVLVAAPVFLGIVLRVNTPHPGAGDGGSVAGALIGQVAGNGIFLSLVATYMLMTLILPLSVAVVSGDSLAGEAGQGTLRTLATIPVGRVRLLLTKYVMIVIFSLTAAAVVSVAGLIMGALLFPLGPVTLLSGVTVPLADALVRLAVITLYVAAALAALGAIGLALSAFTQHALAVMAATLVIVMVSQILDAVSQVAAIHPYLPTHFWFVFDALLRTPIAWSQIWHGLISFACYAVIFGTVAWIRVLRTDITS